MGIILIRESHPTPLPWPYCYGLISSSYQLDTQGLGDPLNSLYFPHMSAGSPGQLWAAGRLVTDLTELRTLQLLGPCVHSCLHLCREKIKEVGLEHLPAPHIIETGLAPHASKIVVMAEQSPSAK